MTWKKQQLLGHLSLYNVVAPDNASSPPSRPTSVCIRHLHTTHTHLATQVTTVTYKPQDHMA